MNKNFEKELPEGYKEALVIDAKNKKTALLFTLISFIPLLILFPIALMLRPLSEGMPPLGEYLITFGIFIVLMIGYIIAHELTHGIAYKALTGQKLTYGFTLTVAYCGVPNIYVYRGAALIALLAPFTVFSVVFAALAVVAYFLLSGVAFLFAVVLFALHFGGCVGDLYDTFLFLFRFKRADTLVRDTGPTQFIYTKE